MLDQSDSYKPTDAAATAEAARRLQQRPSLEHGEAQLRPVVEQIGEAISEIVPGIQWEWIYDETSSNCPVPYDQTNGRILRLQLYVSQQNIPIPDDLWPQVIERIRPIAAAVGATAPATVQNKPGNHDLQFINEEDNTTIRIGSDVSTAIGGTVGCRLPRDQFNTPIEPPP